MKTFHSPFRDLFLPDFDRNLGFAEASCRGCARTKSRTMSRTMSRTIETLSSARFSSRSRSKSMFNCVFRTKTDVRPFPIDSTAVSIPQSSICEVQKSGGGHGVWPDIIHRLSTILSIRSGDSLFTAKRPFEDLQGQLSFTCCTNNDPDRSEDYLQLEIIGKPVYFDLSKLI